MVVVAVQGGRRAAWRPPARILGAYALVMLPLWAWNLASFGGIFSPGPSKTLTLLQYEEIYSYGPPRTVLDYLQQPLGTLVDLRLEALLNEFRVTARAVGGERLELGLLLLGAAVVVGVSCVVAAPRRWSAAVSIPLALAAVHALALPVVSGAGGYLKSSLFVVPISSVLLVDFAARTTQAAGAAARAVIGLLAACLIAAMVLAASTAAREPIANASGRGAAERAIAEGVRQFVDAAYPVVMTRNPWEFHEASGWRAVQIPSDGTSAIVAAGCRYGVDAVVGDRTRPALAEPESLPDEHFRLVGEIRGRLLYAFECSSGDADASDA